MTKALGDCHICGEEQTEIHLLATCARCRAAAGRFSYGPRQTGGRGQKVPAASSWQEGFCCSFCGRKPDEVRKIFSGPWVFICDGCVALAVDAMREDVGPDAWGDVDFKRGVPAPAPSEAPAHHVGRKTSPGFEVREITNVGPGPSRKTPRRR